MFPLPCAADYVAPDSKEVLTLYAEVRCIVSNHSDVILIYGCWSCRNSNTRHLRLLQAVMELTGNRICLLHLVWTQTLDLLEIRYDLAECSGLH